MLTSPSKHNFKTRIPQLFTDLEVLDTLNKYVFSNVALPYSNIHDLFESQIKNVTFNDIGLDTVTQQTATGSVTSVIDRVVHNTLGENDILIEIRTIAGFFNHMLARYAYHLYALDTRNDKLGDVVTYVTDETGLINYKLTYKAVIWLGVEGITFTYDGDIATPESFKIKFKHNGFELEPILNDKRVISNSNQ